MSRETPTSRLVGKGWEGCEEVRSLQSSVIYDNRSFRPRHETPSSLVSRVSSPVFRFQFPLRALGYVGPFAPLVPFSGVAWVCVYSRSRTDDGFRGETRSQKSRQVTLIVG